VLYGPRSGAICRFITRLGLPRVAARHRKLTRRALGTAVTRLSRGISRYAWRRRGGMYSRGAGRYAGLIDLVQETLVSESQAMKRDPLLATPPTTRLARTSC